MSHLLTDDFDIMAMNEHSIKEYVLTSKDEQSIYDKINDPNPSPVPKPKMPTYTNFNIRLADKKHVPEKKRTIKLKNPSEMTVKELKSYLLSTP